MLHLYDQVLQSTSQATRQISKQDLLHEYRTSQFISNFQHTMTVNTEASSLDPRRNRTEDEKRATCRKMTVDSVKGYVRTVVRKQTVPLMKLADLNDFMWRVGKLLKVIQTEKLTM